MTMKLVDEQKSNEAFIRTRGEIQKMVAQVKNAINDPENCRRMFVGRSVTGAGTQLTELNLRLKNGGASKVLLSANTIYPGNFRTTTMRIYEPVGAAPSTARLEMIFRIKNQNMKLWRPWNNAGTDANAYDRFHTENIDIIVQRNGANITECGNVVSTVNMSAKEKFCRSLNDGSANQGAVWDAATQRCRFNGLECPFGQVLNGITRFGQPNCVDIKSKLILDQIFDRNVRCQNTTNRFGIGRNAASGRLEVRCN